VLIRAGELRGAGYVRANGFSAGNATSDGAGGGGAGGTLALRFRGGARCAGLEANGAQGGNVSIAVGPGGGGGGGRILLQSTSNAQCPRFASNGHAGYAAGQDQRGALPEAWGDAQFDGVDESIPGSLVTLSAPVFDTPALNSTVSTRRPSFAGRADAGATVFVAVDERVIGSAQASSSGRFTVVPSQDLPTGLRSARAYAQFQGLASFPSEALSFTVTGEPNDRPPLSLSVPEIIDPVPGSVFVQPSPEFQGLADALVTVDVFLDGELNGSTSADPFGEWKYTPAEALAEGAYALSVKARDNEGNESPISEDVPFSIGLVPAPGRDGGPVTPVPIPSGGCGCRSEVGFPALMALWMAQLAFANRRRSR
jgi:hypothetical protein